MALSQRTLVLGGVSSGKSAWAEAVVLGSGRPPVYMATAEIRDDEMATRVAEHAARRGAGWGVVEPGTAIGPALSAVDPGSVVLLDCATMWLMAWMESGGTEAEAPPAFLAAVSVCPAPVVVVSNEIGLGGVAGDSLSRGFARAHGTLNQVVAEASDTVVLVAAGLPLSLKGPLP